MPPESLFFKNIIPTFLPDRLRKGRTTLESTWLVIVSDYTNVTTAFEMTMNSKHRTEKLKTKSQKDIDTQKNENKGSKKPRE